MVSGLCLSVKDARPGHEQITSYTTCKCVAASVATC
ncbi:hypothetical protein CGRA01v4_14204 [Colletotrichum graminicola]|nr:hypothetical protein CGRA01v4_14204 [Colletotrichum graminicola]